jgi:hypothetical protein
MKKNKLTKWLTEPFLESNHSTSYFIEEKKIKDRLDECIVVASTFDNDMVLGKTRDRNYRPNLKVVRELTGYGVELCYVTDQDTDWSEGMNSHGIGLVNSALFVKRDEKDFDKSKKKKAMSKDGIRIREALSKTKLSDVVKSLLLYHGGIKGHTIVGDGKKLVIIENTSRTKPVVKIKDLTKEPIVRTNHGIEHPEQGYQRGPDKLSSELRLMNALNVVHKISHWKELFPAFYNHKQDKGPKYDLVRAQNKLWTSSQLIMNLNKKEMILYLVPGAAKFMGIENTLPADYKSKIKFTVKEYKHSPQEKYRQFVPTDKKPKYSALVKEDVSIPIEIGDIVKMGKFKNKKVVVKKIDWNEKGDMLINGSSALKFRLMPTSNIFDESKSGDVEEKIRQVFLMEPGSFNTGWKMPKREYRGLIKSLKKQFGSIVDKVVKELEKYKYIEPQGSMVVWNEGIITEGVNDPGILKAIFLAGGPASGKSFVASGLFGIPKSISTSAFGLKLVNQDAELESFLKKYGLGTDLDNMPSDLFKQLTDPGYEDYSGLRNRTKELSLAKLELYKGGRLGVIIDGTGHKFDAIKKQKMELEKIGYDPFMVFVHTDLDVAQKRNEERSRRLPPTLVEKSWKSAQKNMAYFQGLFGNANFLIVDNSSVLSEKQAKKKFDMLVKKGIGKFIRTPVKNRIGKNWIDKQKLIKKRPAKESNIIFNETTEEITISATKEELIDFVATINMDKLLKEESNSTAFPIDDGPPTFYPNFYRYRKTSQDWLEKMYKSLGWKVLDFILSKHALDPDFDYTLKYSIVPAVAYGREGSGKYGSRFGVKNPIKKYMDRLEKVSSTLGWEIIKWFGIKDDLSGYTGVEVEPPVAFGVDGEVENTDKKELDEILDLSDEVKLIIEDVLI